MPKEGRLDRQHLRAAKVAVPEDIRVRSGLSRIDHEVAFGVAIGPADHRDAEQWARAIYEQGPPRAQRLLVWYGWKLLSARLGPYPSDDHVLGYRISEIEPDFIRFSVTWAMGLACDLVVYTRQSTAVLASFVELQRKAARVVWPAVVPIHERIVSWWLTRAARGGALVTSPTVLRRGGEDRDRPPRRG